MALIPNRKIHLVDIENICGNPRPLRSEVEAARQSYEDLVALGPDDHVVLACNHGACMEVGLGWCGARLVVRSGPDGADLALLKVISDEEVPARFDSVVIASGDGIFADAASRLAREGVDVTVVTRERALSGRLRLAAGQVTYFPECDFYRDAA